MVAFIKTSTKLNNSEVWQRQVKRRSLMTHTPRKERKKVSLH